MLNGNTLEYVASGMSFTRITAGKEVFEGELNEQIKAMFSAMQTVGANHKFSCLANALTEVEICKLLVEFDDVLHAKYNDSGALQIAQGSQKNRKCGENDKINVYEVQSKYSDFGFIFDEPPIGFAGDQVSKHASSQKWFESTRVEEAAIITGKNVANQLEVFERNKSDAKVQLIAHGNCLSSYQEGLEIIMQQIPTKLAHRIGGLAIGGGCLGNGPLEDAKKAFFFSQLDHGLETKHIHILGVGSVTRLIPFFIMIQNGMFKDLRISYDSTTHTSGSTFGRYNFTGTDVSVQKDKKKWEKVYEDVQKKFGFADVTFEDFFEAGLASSFVKYEEKNGQKDTLIRTQLALALGSTWNFIESAEKFLTNKELILKTIKGSKKFRPLQFLYQVKNANDFKAWDEQFGRHLQSRGVAATRPATLEDFFE
jgi:hypothetical protein